jgi:glycine/D-amino acid oxidase-like deaminating enzyme
MKIAVIGAGFCGLATAWHLLNKLPVSSLVLFDQRGIGGGASGIAAGLLHPFSGAHAKLNRFGREGMIETHELLTISSQALGTPVFNQQGILRLALTEEQKNDFLLCQTKYPSDVEWLESEQCQRLFPYLTSKPGLWIKNGITINSSLYLKGLWKACQEKGALLNIREIRQLEELQDFDLKIFTIGAHPQLLPLPIPLSSVKGQVLELEWPSHLPPLPFALNSQAYLIMNSSLKTCLAGATFEKDYLHSDPDLEIAKKEILPKVIAMLPHLESAPIINCYAGLRSVTPTHLPLIKQMNQNTWILTGMGSKGLLYHALMAKKLIEQICSTFLNDFDLNKKSFSIELPLKT